MVARDTVAQRKVCSRCALASCDCRYDKCPCPVPGLLAEALQQHRRLRHWLPFGPRDQLEAIDAERRWLQCFKQQARDRQPVRLVFLGANMDCQPQRPGTWYWPLVAKAIGRARARTCPITLLGAPDRQAAPRAAASAASAAPPVSASAALRTVNDTPNSNIRARLRMAQHSHVSVRPCEVADMLRSTRPCSL